MSIVSRIIGKIFKLPPAETHDVVVERGLKVPMPDGTILLADHYYPRGNSRPPTVLIRCPYGRGRLNALEARLFSERGFQVLLQSCRGTFGSGGQFNPFRNEQADGLATIEWMKQQEWFSGDFATVGASYLGYAHWAIARKAGPGLKAIAAQVTTTDFRGLIYPGESFALSDCVSWSNILYTQEKSRLGDFSAVFAGRKLQPVFHHLPVCEADRMITGQSLQFWRDLLEHGEPDDKWWEPISHSRTVTEVTAPVNLIGGWYDIFLPCLMKDYAALKNAGRAPYLMIGPWAHADAGLQMMYSKRESIIWLRAQLLGDRSCLREKPVRLYVMGAREWRDLPGWPPPGCQPQAWYLLGNRKLAPELPGASEPDRYRYDPADPTPNVGGAMINRGSGAKDNRTLESRPDVLTYTGAVLEQDLEVIGPVQAALHVHSSLEHTDFFVRLCDVHPSGKSLNICDGIRRLKPGRPAPDKDGTIKVDIEMWPTAYRFLKGHRVRLQVSSGAHPRFARNLGSGEPLATGVSMRTADQTVYHDPGHPSCIVLPVNNQV